MLPPFTLAAADQFASETAARPLFTPTRRPAPPAATVQATMRKGQFVLTGITVSAEASFAFLKEVSSGKTRSVRKGAEVNGLRVDAVEPRRVVLRQGEETEDLMLAIQVPPRTAAPAPAPGAPAAGSAAPNIYAPGGVPLPRGPGRSSAGGHARGRRAGCCTSDQSRSHACPGVESTASRRRPWMKP